MWHMLCHILYVRSGSDFCQIFPENICFYTKLWFGFESVYLSIGVCWYLLTLYDIKHQATPPVDLDKPIAYPSFPAINAKRFYIMNKNIILNFHIELSFWILISNIVRFWFLISIHKVVFNITNSRVLNWLNWFCKRSSNNLKYFRDFPCWEY